ncbi:MAG: hypothetical protein ACOCWM_02085 [Cyclobacteriaceae bacterium]
MFSLIRRLFFRKKINIDWDSFVIEAVDERYDKWRVLDGGRSVFEGSKDECYEFIDALKKIVKKFF